ncbi:MAG: hypothetical protein FWB73_03855 [Treponema sp.]|nr:hypothetical protein [Treponema sp.]
MLFRKVLTFICCFLAAGLLSAQDFGFGFGEEESGAKPGSSVKLSASIGGEVSAGIIAYIDDMAEGADHINTREMFSLMGKLNFSAKTSFAEGVINLKFVPALIPVSIDEAYISAFFGGFEITAGLMKLSWGKADQLGPLDVINLPDTSRLFIEMADNTNLMGVKLANPVVHASYRFGKFSKIELAFLPSFDIVGAAIQTAVIPMDETNPMALLIGSGAARWIPKQMKLDGNNLLRSFPTVMTPDGNTVIAMSNLIMPEFSMLDHAQAGLRFTSSIGNADFGAQYFFGRMYQPAVKYALPTGSYDFMDPRTYPTIEFLFNNYHQLGFDYAHVLWGFNIRAELAANLTYDFTGDDAYIYNPSIAWSLGFDRNLFLGINLNLQVNETIRLLNSKVGSSKEPFTEMGAINPNFDIEADTSITATRITAMISKKFLRDELELRTAVVWGIEGRKADGKWNGGDAAIIPALIWTRDDLRTALSGCFFVGDPEGQLGQYAVNNFLKISVAYVF